MVGIVGLDVGLGVVVDRHGELSPDPEAGPDAFAPERIQALPLAQREVLDHRTGRRGRTDHPSENGVGAFRAGALQRYRGRIVKDAPVTVNGYPGRDLFVNFGRFRIARIRTCLADTRFHQVVVVSVRSFVHPDRVRALRFLWSFRVVGAIQFV